MTTTYAKLRINGIVFDPASQAGAAEGELYVDSTSGQLSVKGGGSSTTPIGAAPSADQALNKVMENQSGSTIPLNALVAKLANGTIAQADSDGNANVIGIAQAAIPNLSTGTVRLLGPNIAGVLTGLGFAPGQSVYMSETTGHYTTNINSFTGSNDRLVRVGIADCAAGFASTTVVDLLAILTEEVAQLV